MPTATNVDWSASTATLALPVAVDDAAAPAARSIERSNNRQGAAATPAPSKNQRMPICGTEVAPNYRLPNRTNETLKRNRAAR